MKYGDMFYDRVEDISFYLIILVDGGILRESPYFYACLVTLFISVQDFFFYKTHLHSRRCLLFVLFDVYFVTSLLYLFILTCVRLLLFRNRYKWNKPGYNLRSGPPPFSYPSLSFSFPFPEKRKPDRFDGVSIPEYTVEPLKNAIMLRHISNFRSGGDRIICDVVAYRRLISNRQLLKCVRSCMRAGSNTRGSNYGDLTFGKERFDCILFPE